MVAVLPEPFATQIGALRRRHDRWSKSWLPPHITIIRPLKALPVTMYQRAASLRYPFHVSLHGWQTFHNPNDHVVWLDPGQDEPCRVTRMIYNECSELNKLDSGSYRPGEEHVYHVSVANHIPDEAYKTIWESLRLETIEGECTIERVSVFVRGLPDGHWRLIG